MADANSPAERPLSPHLQIYKPLLNMVMSILHRMTGTALYLGTLLLAWWLIAASVGPDYFNLVNGYLSSFLGRLILFAYTWALFLHMLGGLRHFIWDTGRGLDNRTVDLLGWLTLFGSVGLTLAAWVAGYAAMGAF